MKRIILITSSVLAFVLTLYTVVFFSVGESTLVNLLESTVGEIGIEFKVRHVNKVFPLSLIIEDALIRIRKMPEPVKIPRIELALEPFSGLDGKIIKIDILDREGDSIRVFSNLGFRDLNVEGHDFDFLSDATTGLPSFSLKYLYAHISISQREKQSASVRGNGKFDFDSVTAEVNGFPVTIARLNGNFIVRDGALYFRETRGQLLETLFSVKGTVYLNTRTPGQLNLEVILSDPSPLLSNILNLHPKHGNKLKINIRGTIAKPLINRGEYTR